MSKITDIFYNEVISEASKGRVDSYFYYNILFETYFKEEDRKISSDVKNMLIPILTIHNKEEFNSLLERYVKICLSFYDDTNFEKEVNEDINLKIKTIITLLFSNATGEDFEDAENFLRKRISFINNNIETDTEFGHSKILDGDILLEITKDKIYNEMPYKMMFKVVNNDTYSFPEVKFGIYEDKVYIYAIQNMADNNNSYAKKVNRTLYKVGENFKDKPELKDISASFLVTLNMAVSYFQKLGYSEIVSPGILLPRYNAKKMKIELLKGRKTEEEIFNMQNMQSIIQNNLTEKFLRTFYRLKYHFDDVIDIPYFPYMKDSCLHMTVNDVLKGNNSLLNETALLVRNNSYYR